MVLITMPIATLYEFALERGKTVCLLCRIFPAISLSILPVKEFFKIKSDSYILKIFVHPEILRTPICTENNLLIQSNLSFKRRQVIEIKILQSGYGHPHLPE